MDSGIKKGAWDEKKNTIYVHGHLTNEQMVVTLFHEYQHSIENKSELKALGVDPEAQARILAEQFSIDIGLPLDNVKSKANYRTSDNQVNKEFILSQFEKVVPEVRNNKVATALGQYYADTKAKGGKTAKFEDTYSVKF